MKVLSWNVQGAFPQHTPLDRIQNQIQYIQDEAGCSDILMLNEVNRYPERRKTWEEELTKLGYIEIVHTLDWAEELGESDVQPNQDYNHVNGNLIAVHEDADGKNLTREPASIRYGQWDDTDMKDWDTNFPEKILHATLEMEDTTLDLWNIRAVPGNMHGEEKIKILDNTYHRIKKGYESPCLLAGDFNSPDRELTDGTLVPWRADKDGAVAEMWVEAERNILTGLEEIGMVDVFRDQHGYGELDVLDVSHATQTENPLEVPAGEVQGKRFDHMIASTELNPADCYYDQAGFSCSDHAPLIGEFNR